MEYKNGNGAASPVKVMTGVSLAHRRLTSQQKAVIAADILDGWVRYTPSQKELADILGVSVTYVMAARKLPPGKRALVLRDYDVGFPTLVNPPRQLALPTPKLEIVDDDTLIDMARVVGADRMLAAAVAAETHA